MFNKYLSSGLLRGLAAAALFAGMNAARADSLVLVTSAAAQKANDSVAWSSVGGEGTGLTAGGNVISTKGATVHIALKGPGSILSVACPATPCSWTDSGFPGGDTLMWSSDAGNGGNGPVTLGFTSGIAGAGALIQADGPGQFTAKIEAFNGANSLGFFTVPSDAQGSPLYVGVLDQSGSNVTSVVFSLTSVTAGLAADFALDTVYLTTAPVSGSGSITATGGTPQSATVTTAFAVQFAATVKDSNGSPVSGVTVTFNAPGSGASGTFAGGVNTATTNAQGVATAPVFTANGTTGLYAVTATALGLTTNPGFSLTNITDVPTVANANPASGSGASHVFQFSFTEPTGWQNLGVENVLINSALDGRQACYVAYVRSANILYLVDDSGAGLLPGITLNGSGSVSNSHCTVQGAGSSATGSGTTLTLNLNLTFLAAFAGNKVVYAAAGNQAQHNSGWVDAGVWQVPGTGTPVLQVQGMTPSYGQGHSQSFAFTFSDTNGYQDLGVVDMLMNQYLDGRQACYVAYVRKANIIYLVSDDGGSLLGPLALNGTGSVSNTQCTINGTGSSVSVSGNAMTLTLNYTFNSGFAGNKIFYLAAGNAGSTGNTGWQALGGWTVQ